MGAVAVLAIVACRDNPNIDGSKVPTVGDPDAGDIPTCAQICPRLAALCGYAPDDCTDADAGGYCDTQLADDATLSCMGVAASCQDARDCGGSEPAPTDDSGSTDETATGEGGDDSSADAASE